ncbi:tetratricopeptide repeat protein [Halospina denitrificans]|uniref:Tetratricopeptide repeat protein n=1 Tax=Halospina denitrificans TaxID=332522 RepID=A0A4R7JYS1_9GAMM|nr:tetratricopeptide repeat protein [Halospina denitrificans]TDT43365.1 tetratricopeptide repeat protein [Halospina denitrificans]
MRIRSSAALLALMLLTLSSAHALVIDRFFPQPPSQYRPGIEALENERYQEAISLGEEYARLAPKDERAHLILVLAWYGQGGHTAIDRHLRELDARFPDIAQSIRSSLMTLYARDGRSEAALRHFGNLQPEAKTTDLYVLAGDLHHQGNRMDLAVVNYEKALEQAPRHEGARLGLARTHLVSGRFPEAADHAERLLDQYAEHRGALTVASTAYLKLNQPQKALAKTRTFRERAPNPAALSNIALSEFATGHYERAHEAFSALGRYSEWGDDAVVGRALCDIARERIDQARSVLNNADTRDAPLSTILAASLMTNESGNDGVQHTLKAGSPVWLDLQRPLLSLSGLVGSSPMSEADYNQELVAVVTAQLYLNQGFPELALSLSEPVGNLKASAFGRLVLGRAYGKMERADEAVHTLEALVRDYPKLLAPRLEIADIHFHQGDHAEALATYENAVIRHPELPELQVRLGDLYNELGNPASALLQYERFLEQEPDSPYALKQAAATLARLDRPEEGLELAERAHELAPYDANIADTLVSVHRKLGNEAAAAKIQSSFSRTHGEDVPSNSTLY